MSSNKGIIFCPLCGKKSLDFDVWVKTDIGDIVKCKRCGLGFLNPQNFRDFKNINTSIYNEKRYYKRLIRMQGELTSRYKNQMKEIKRIVKKKGKIVDIGCSIGMFLNVASSFGFELYGFDLNKINLQKAKKLFNINTLPDNFLKNQKFNNFFNVATMWDVLEHLEDPIGFLSRLILKIKPGGLLVVQCPNMESYVFLKFGKRWNWLTPGDHLQFFTPYTLTKVITAAGFHPIKVKIWEDGFTFSRAMISLYNKDPTFIFNRLLYKIILKAKSIFKKLEIDIPFEKILVLYGWLLQIIHNARRRLSLIKIFAVKPIDSSKQ